MTTYFGVHVAELGVVVGLVAAGQPAVAGAAAELVVVGFLVVVVEVFYAVVVVGICFVDSIV